MNNYTIHTYIVNTGMSFAGHRVYNVDATSKEHAQDIVKAHAKTYGGVAIIKKTTVNVSF